MDLLREWRALARTELTTGDLNASVLPPPGGSRPPSRPHSSHHDDEPPTEISKPDAVPAHLLRLAGTSSDDEELPATRTPVDFEGLLPPEKYPTNEPLIKGPASNPAGSYASHGQGAKVAMMIAIAASLAALCIFAFAFSRPDPPTRKRTAATAPPPVLDPAESDPALAPPAVPSDEVVSSDDMELPANGASPSTRSTTPARRPVWRPRPPPPATSPKPKQPPQQGITTDPRY